MGIKYRIISGNTGPSLSSADIDANFKYVSDRSNIAINGLNNRVLDTTTTTGSNTIVVLSGSPDANTKGIASLFAVNTTLKYCIDDLAGNWEETNGIVNANNTITRATTPIKSSNTGAQVNFGSGTKYISVVSDVSDLLPNQSTSMAKPSLRTANGTPYWDDGSFETLDPTYSQSLLVLDSTNKILGMFPDSDIDIDTISSVWFETINPDYTPLKSVYLDANNKVLDISPNAIHTSQISTLQTQVAALSVSVTTPIFETLEDATYGIPFIDAAGKLIAYLSDQTSVALQISPIQNQVNNGLTPYGDPLGPYANSWQMRDVRCRLRQLANGDTSKLIITFIGDSFTHGDYYTQAVTQQLQNQYGFGGSGWVGFGSFIGGTPPWTVSNQPQTVAGNARPDVCPRPQLVGNWVTLGGTDMPGMTTINSNTAGDYVSFIVPNKNTAAQLFYSGDGTGIVKLSLDNGATFGANIPLSTVGAANVALSGITGNTAAVFTASIGGTALTVTSVTSGTIAVGQVITYAGNNTPVYIVSGSGTSWTLSASLSGTALNITSYTPLRLQVVSGNVALGGVNLTSSNSGVVVHKLGWMGTTAKTWLNVTSAWAVQLAALGSQAHCIMFGTNDQSSYHPIQFANYMLSIISNIRANIPIGDILLATPYENNRTTNLYPMTQLASAVRAQAVPASLTFMDVQYFFGSPANYGADYAFVNAYRSWVASDLIHPTSAGGKVIADAFIRLFTSL